MKWMSWGPSDLEEADPELVNEIAEMINEEHEAMEQMAAERG